MTNPQSKATTFYNQKAYKKAIHLLEANLKGNANDPQTLLLLSTCYLHTRRYKEAERVASQLIALQPNNAKALLHLGISQQYTNKLEQAHTNIAQAIKLDPDDDVGYLAASNLLLAYRQFAEAEALLRQAIQINSQKLDTHRLLIQALIGQRRYADALMTARNAITAQPSFVTRWLLWETWLEASYIGRLRWLLLVMITVLNFTPYTLLRSVLLIICAGYLILRASYVWQVTHHRLSVGFFLVGITVLIGGTLNFHTPVNRPIAQNTHPNHPALIQDAIRKGKNDRIALQVYQFFWQDTPEKVWVLWPLGQGVSYEDRLWVEFDITNLSPKTSGINCHLFDQNQRGYRETLSAKLPDDLDLFAQSLTPSETKRGIKVFTIPKNIPNLTFECEEVALKLS